ncbi:MAG: hypothetical protein Aurels2KO_18550 [Aureliella sp.]
MFDSRNTIDKWCVVGCLLACLGGQSAIAQYSPSHPKVQKLVDAGVAFLKQSQGARGGYSAGSNALIAYALYKATGDDELVQVKRGIADSKRLAASLATGGRHDEKVVYEVGMAAVLLATIDMASYQPELLQIREWLLEVQKPHGGFGYLEKPTGDTSQVQYAMLAMWTMQQAGMEIPTDSVEACIDYLKATMDPTGGWGYQGVIGNGRLVPQEKVSKSLGTAGAGALIIGGDMLSLFGARKTPRDESEGVPSAFVRTDLRTEARKKRSVSLSRSDVEQPLTLARRYQNTSKFAGAYWYYYWRYSQERYESFVEIVEGRQEKSPAWYNRGVEELAKFQDASGGWGKVGKRDFYSEDVSTAFAVLFLIRSTQKAIGKLDEGVVRGGYGLPSNVSNIKMVGGNIVSAEQASIDSLLSMLEDNGTAGVEVGLVAKDMKLSPNPAVRKEQVARLSRLLDSRDAKARRVAAKLLGRSDDLDQVPDLVYALTDPDPFVPMIAEESLRLLSRKLTAGKLKASPSNEDKQVAVDYWKKWYLGLRPDYVFVDRQ